MPLVLKLWIFSVMASAVIATASGCDDKARSWMRKEQMTSWKKKEEAKVFLEATCFSKMNVWEKEGRTRDMKPAEGQVRNAAIDGLRLYFTQSLSLSHRRTPLQEQQLCRRRLSQGHQSRSWPPDPHTFYHTAESEPLFFQALNEAQSSSLGSVEEIEETADRAQDCESAMSY